MKTKLLIPLFATLFIFGCRSNSFDRESKFEAEKSVSATMLDEQGSTPTSPSESNANVDKKIIKTAYISVEVLNYANSRKLIDSTLKKYNAYILNENLQNTEAQISNSINIRVPAAQFEELLARLAKMAKRVDYQNIETQDFTEEYIDVQSRLTNSRKIEQTYLKLLRKAGSIEDILKIEQKLGEIRTDIESTEGRIKYLNHQVDYSTINLNVYQTIEYKYIPDKRPNFFQRLVRALDMGWKGVITFLLFLIRFWPLWLILASGWFGWKYYVKLRKQRRKNEKKRKKMLKREAQEEQNLPH